MDLKEIEVSIKKWCKEYTDGPVTEYSSEQEVFRDALVYDDDEVHIIRMKSENRITVSVASNPFFDSDPEYQLIRRIGLEQWEEIIKGLAALYGPVDVTFFGDHESHGYNLVDYVYDDIFTVDLLHQRCRRLITVNRLIHTKLESLYDKIRGTTRRWLLEIL